jgi:hypothetical protein
MATFSNIGIEESSTLTGKVATVVIQRGSSNEHQEILCLGDPTSSLAVAAVTSSAPAGNAFGLGVRLVGGPSSAVDVTIRALLSSTNTDNPVRAVLSSTSTDNPISIGNIVATAGRIPIGSTAADNVVTVGTISAGAGRINIGSTAADNVISLGTISAGAGRINIGSTAADNVVRALLSSTSTDNPVQIASIGAAAGRINIGSTAADNVVSLGTIAAGAGRINIGSTAADNVVRALLSSTSTDNPVRALFSSTSADNPFQINTVLDSSNAACKVGDQANLALRVRIVASDLAGSTTVAISNCQSSVAPSSNSSAFTVRQVVDNILTVASTNAFTSTLFTIQSSGAALRCYVTAYSILSTNAGPSKIKFYSSGTMIWPMVFAATSSAVSGANLAVSAPAYLFRTAASEALSLHLGSGASTVAGYQVAVSYFIAP